MICFLVLQRIRADTRLVSRVLERVIDSREVEVHLAGVFGFEGTGLEVDDDEAAECQVVEEEINEEVLASYF